YPQLSSEKGYPSAAAPGAIAGQVVHAALERIVGAAREAVANGRCATEGEPMGLVVDVLRSLGGISAVLEAVIAGIVTEWDANPRVRPRARELADELRRQVPLLRPRVQHFLGSLSLGGLRASRAVTTESAHQHGSSWRPLAPGLHAEVPLVNKELGFYGKADLVRVGATEDGDGDEIVDFKTGLAKPDHAFQLRVYALLWAREKRWNPGGRRAHRLTVLYGNGPIGVPAPTTDEELDTVAREVAERSAKVRADVAQLPPAARASREACEWCDVRQMCDVYWASDTRGTIASPADSPRQGVDAGVRIVQRVGPWSWVALVHEVGALSEHIAIGDRVLLRARPQEDHFAALIDVGARARIVSALYVPPSDESGGLAVLSLTRSTEAYLS
ncbi:MAG TPA: PD-(D/E)XK nuclease family protein, partial [Gemmatimonadaceae bacterium]